MSICHKCFYLSNPIGAKEGRKLRITVSLAPSNSKFFE